MYSNSEALRHNAVEKNNNAVNEKAIHELSLLNKNNNNKDNQDDDDESYEIDNNNVEDFYEVEYIAMDSCYTTTYLKDFPKLSFNSVNFEYFESIDIYKDSRYNPYLGGRL